MTIYTEDYLRNRSKEILKGKADKGRIFDTNAEDNVPKFDPEDIEFGGALGTGGFCTVYTLKRVKYNPEDSEQKPAANEDAYSQFVTVQDKDFIAKNYIRDGQARYAIKKMTKNLHEKGDHQHFMRGVIDLSTEVMYLAVLRHPHIIKMRAISSVNYCSKDFFIIMDKLYGTLDVRIEVWKKESAKFFIKKEDKEEMFADRIMVAHDLASAMCFLHENNIIYRDLKPDNIGFDIRDDVKIFDFGLAAEMPPSRNPTDTFDFTGNTGSPRYMAPEVALCQPYNDTSDVYSFGILMNFIFDLKMPFANFSRVKMTQKVYKGKERPKVNKKWPADIKKLLPRCWDRTIANRPHFPEVKETLQSAAQNLLGGDLLLDNTNRSARSVMARN